MGSHYFLNILYDNNKVYFCKTNSLTNYRQKYTNTEKTVSLKHVFTNSILILSACS